MSEQSELCSDMARGNNPDPLRLSAVLLEEYPIGLLAGGAFAPYERFAAGKILMPGRFIRPEQIIMRGPPHDMVVWGVTRWPR